MPNQNRFTLNIVVSNALLALDFYEKVLNAKRGDIFEFPNRRRENEVNVFVGNVALRLIDDNPAYECFAPKQGATDFMWLQLRVDNVDATLVRAENQGATQIQTPSEFMGMYHAQFTDPFGYTWTIYQQLKEISFQDRYEAYSKLQEDKATEEAKEEGTTQTIKRTAEAE